MATTIRKVTSVDSYIRALPPEKAALLVAARELILGLQPEMTITLKWQIPYFSCKGPLCLLYYDRRRDRLLLGFAKGHLLSNSYGLLSDQGSSPTGETMNTMRVIEITSESQLESEAVLATLDEAIRLNEEAHAARSAKRKSRLR